MEIVRMSRGVTLIELLVVMAVISLLLGLFLPVSRRMRTICRRTTCQGRLRQIACAWEMYFNDNDDRFLQRVNANHNFGGWEGLGVLGSHRPLNAYVGLSPTARIRRDADVFRCPSDSGGILGQPPLLTAFDYYGNSYQTNILLIGPDQVVVPGGRLGPLHEQINVRLRGLKRADAGDHCRTLLVGDNAWVDAWLPGVSHRQPWHGRSYQYNLAFLDGHVDFLLIRKGLYVADDYNVLPFKELYELAREAQEEEF